MREPCPERRTRRVFDDDVAVPLPRSPEDDRVFTVMLLAAEMIAERNGTAGPRSVDCAVATSADDSPGLVAEARELADAMEAAARVLAGTNTLKATTALLSELFGQGAGLADIYRNMFPERRSDDCGPPRRNVRLTSREQAVLLESARGSPHRISAEAMGISIKTVERHLAKAYEKLGAHHPLQAALRAAALGCIPIGSVQELTQLQDLHLRTTRPWDHFCWSPGLIGQPRDTRASRPMADGALAMLAVAAATERNVHGDGGPGFARGALCSVDGAGTIRAIPLEPSIEIIRSIAIAPPVSAATGFEPGAIYAAHDMHPQACLNRAAISLVRGNGIVARTFCGGSYVGCRLIGPVAIAFAPDGRLMATSGWLTDAILAFTDGGREVRRFADAHCTGVAAAAEGEILAANVCRLRASIEVRDATGQLTNSFGSQDRAQYEGLVVSPDGSVYVGREAAAGRVILRYSCDGEFLGEVAVTGHAFGSFACTPEGNLCVPCPGDRQVRVVSPSGGTLRVIPCAGLVLPVCTAVGPDGIIYIGGECDKNAGIG